MRLIDADVLEEKLSMLLDKIPPNTYGSLAHFTRELIERIKIQPCFDVPAVSLPNAPLTLDELLEMDGKQVWINQPDGSEDCSGWAGVELAAAWKPGGPKPHVFVVFPNGDRDYAGLLLECGVKIYRHKPKEESR